MDERTAGRWACSLSSPPFNEKACAPQVNVPLIGRSWVSGERNADGDDDGIHEEHETHTLPLRLLGVVAGPVDLV